MALLVAALQWIEEPGANSLILRRTYKQLAKSDSILNKSKEWLMGRTDRRGRPVKWNGDERKWTFPNGNTLEFGHMEHEDAKFDYQGGIWAFVGADEATQFTGPMLAYPRTRQRRPAAARYPLRWRGASNPGGVGHEYVKARYVQDENGNDPSTPDRQFFPARVEDNPNIDRDDYVRQLRESGIDALTLAQLLAGDWDAVPGGRFLREWFGGWRRDPDSPDFVRLYRGAELAERFNWTQRLRFQTCDPAASTSTAADYTCLSTWLVSPKGNLLWWACERRKLELPEQVDLVRASYRRHGAKFVTVEEVLNQRSLAQVLRRPAADGSAVVVKGVMPGGQKKLEHAIGAVVLASDGRVFLPEADPTFPLADVLGELCRFTGDDKVDANDDIVDTLSYAAEQLPRLGHGTPTALPAGVGGVPGPRQAVPGFGQRPTGR